MNLIPLKQFKPLLLRAAKTAGTPLYVFDVKGMRNNLQAFKRAFKKHGVDIHIFFAVKSNYYLGLLKTVVQEGEGLDVSSQRELKLALRAKAKEIVYTGPAKTEADFKLILKHHSKIRVNLESIRELELLAKMAKAKKVRVRCGLRISTALQNDWTKFGLPLNQLKTFYHKAQQYPSIQLCGIHFHTSFNRTPDSYVKNLKILSDYLKENFNHRERATFQYLDIGGGFYPESIEGIYPWNPKGDIKSFDVCLLDDICADKFQPRYSPPIPVSPIDEFGSQIAAVYKSEIRPLLPNAQFLAEPGRFIANNSMHILLKLIEVKEDFKGTKTGIADGGNNMIGWEKYQFCNYVPMFNLTQFTLEREIPFVVYGSLCTPYDIWGYYLYTANEPKPGDFLWIPFQGAYTYALAQEFIKEIPPVYDLK
ncbi:MAG: alanine racemase [Candidatus Peregrinibacteria bacterium]